jgi:ADP-ribose pyrophosphatase
MNLLPDATFPGSSNEGEIEILSAEEVYSNFFGTLFDDHVAFPSGKVGRYLRFSWRPKYSVAVLPILRDESILLLRVFRHALRNWSLEACKGFGENGADPKQVASNELLEEAGLRYSELRPLGFAYTDPGFIGTPCILFVAVGCYYGDTPSPEDTETLHVAGEFSRAEIMSMISANKVYDTVTSLLLLRYLAGV